MKCSVCIGFLVALTDNVGYIVINKVRLLLSFRQFILDNLNMRLILPIRVIINGFGQLLGDDKLVQLDLLLLNPLSKFLKIAVNLMNHLFLVIVLLIIIRQYEIQDVL